MSLGGQVLPRLDFSCPQYLLLSMQCSVYVQIHPWAYDKVFHSPPAEWNSNECITGHFTQLGKVRLLRGPLLYIPYRYAFAKLCLSLANMSKLLSSCLYNSSNVEPIWLVYNVNVFLFFQCFLHLQCFLILRNKIRVTFFNTFTVFTRVLFPNTF